MSVTVEQADRDRAIKCINEALRHCPDVSDLDVEALYRHFARHRTESISSKDARIAELEAEVADLKTSVVAFAGPYADRYAKEFGLAKGELHPVHYDILAKCGARMADFTRAEPALGEGKAL